VKIAFDENVPVQMVRVFKALGQEKRFKKLNIEIKSAVDYTPKPTDPDYSPNNDVPWLTRFARAGGQVVISGDTEMIEVPHELEALRRGAFTVFFFERKWSRWSFYEKTSHLLFHWPVILAKLKAAKRPRFWCVPNHFKADGVLRDVTPGAKEIKKAKPRSAGGKAQAGGQRPGHEVDGRGVHADRADGRKKRKPSQQDIRQGSLELTGGGTSTASAPPPERPK
jgi:hypothetical protein